MQGKSVWSLYQEGLSKPSYQEEDYPGGESYPGEEPLADAPFAVLSNGYRRIPQQFYLFRHSLNSLEALLSDISFSEHFPVFSGEDQSGLYIQVGIIGHENYADLTRPLARKIVYGRKWRVEPNLPTSEVIQTVFLALKKAREHELRELLTLEHIDSGSRKRRSTPFNNHHDLPMMAHADLSVNSGADLLTSTSLTALLDAMRFGKRALQLLKVETRASGQIIVDINVGIPPNSSHNGFPEYNNLPLTLVLSAPSLNELMFALMDALLSVSERYVEEHFLYRGFARFSRQHNIRAIGRFSVETRCFDQEVISPQFDQCFQTLCGEVDMTRVPMLKTSAQMIRLGAALEGAGIEEGYLPAELDRAS